eukprot:688966-Prymnesium_polylepis.1
MLHPEAVTLEDVSFADGKTGVALTPARLSSRSLRTLVDGETLLLVRGDPMPVLDPTQVVLPWQENVKGLVLGVGGALVNVWAMAHFSMFSFLVPAAACGSIGFAWPAIWKQLPGATKPAFKRLPNKPGRGIASGNLE